jgi:hypothetical protein
MALYQIYTCNIGIYLLFSGPRPYLASGILSKGQVFHAQTAIFYWINSATSLIYWPTRPYIATGVQAYFSLHSKAPILHWLVNDSNRF